MNKSHPTFRSIPSPRVSRSRAFALALVAGTLAASPVFGQSDPGDFTTVINIPEDAPTISGTIGSDTQLNLSDGGVIESGFEIGAYEAENLNIEVNLFGGTVGINLTAHANSVVNVLGGSIGDGFHAGGEVTFSGGEIGDDAAIYTGAEMTMTGGSIGGYFDVNQGAVFNLVDGQVGTSFSTNDGGVVNAYGGLITNYRGNSGSTTNLFGGKSQGSFWSKTGSELNVYGGEFKIDGELVATIPAEGLGGPSGKPGAFYGVFQNGEVFVFSTASRGDVFYPNTVNLIPVTLPVVDLTPIVVTDTESPVTSLRPGQSLTLSGSGSIPDHFRSVGATLHLNGGTVGDRLQAAETQVVMQDGQFGSQAYLTFGCDFSMSGGQIGDGLHFDGNTFELSGGSIGSNFSLSSYASSLLMSEGTIGEDANFRGLVTQTGGSVGLSAQISGFSRYTISGGAIGPELVVVSYARLDIQGGWVGAGMSIGAVGSVIISGGQIDAGLKAFDSSILEVQGHAFELEDVPLNLDLGESLVITDRDAELTCILADGTPFSLALNSTNQPGQDYVSPSATLTVIGTLSTQCPPDVNLDGVVDQGDIQAFIAYFLAGNLGVDLNGDGVLDLGDIGAFVTEFLAGC